LSGASDFSFKNPKILFSKSLAKLQYPHSSQNIDPKQLTRKILQTSNLACTGSFAFADRTWR
jgi:hypothetical protein